jgi:hypothetical protein
VWYALHSATTLAPCRPIATTPDIVATIGGIPYIGGLALALNFLFASLWIALLAPTLSGHLIGVAPTLLRRFCNSCTVRLERLSGRCVVTSTQFRSTYPLSVCQSTMSLSPLAHQTCLGRLGLFWHCHGFDLALANGEGSLHRLLEGCRLHTDHSRGKASRTNSRRERARVDE